MAEASKLTNAGPASHLAHLGFPCAHISWYYQSQIHLNSHLVSAQLKFEVNCPYPTAIVTEKALLVFSVILHFNFWVPMTAPNNSAKNRMFDSCPKMFNSMFNSLFTTFFDSSLTPNV